MRLTKVFYDGKCGLCSKEINYYKRIAPKNIFEWHDIASNPEKLKELHRGFKKIQSSSQELWNR